MATSVSLRKSLRKIPDFRLLPRRELETIIERMICREYKPGEVIWRTGAQTDYLAIVQKGEIVLERRIHSSVQRSLNLSAGDYLLPRKLKIRNPHSIVLARAITDARLYFLPIKQSHIHQTVSFYAGVGPSRADFGPRVFWNGLWLAIVAMLIVALTWTDLTRIASGILYMVSANTDQPAFDEQRSLKLLHYAESIDHQADFAYNREGYIWFQRDNLLQAEAAFMQALNVDQADGPALNNQAVTYFTVGQIPQAAMYQQKAAGSEPDNAVIKYNLGVVLLKAGDYTKALREFKEASFINPTWALPYIQQGFIYLRMGEDVNAERVARKAIHLDFTQQSAHLILAMALHHQGLHQEASNAVEYVLQISPQDRVARFYQAHILTSLGEFDGALSAWNQLLESADKPQEASRINAEIEAVHRYLQNAASGIPE